MKVEKLKSGSYRVRQQYNGNRYSINFDHKPTAKEINVAFAERMARAENDAIADGTLLQKSKDYLEKSEKEGKSPTTIKGYKSIQTNTPHWFLFEDVSKITSETVQTVVDEYLETHSAKSTRLFYSYWKCAIESCRPYIKLNIKLPSLVKRHEYEPTTKDIKLILEYAKDSKYYIVLKLATIGLRRGEACAITASDLDNDNILTINKDMVVDLNNKQVIKHTPKTAASNRRILIPSDVADMIRENKNAYVGNMHSINEYLHKCQDALKIPRFRLHIIRHFAAAYLLKNGFTTVQIEDYMGWEHGSSVMQKVYAYNLDPHESQKDIASVFSEL